MATADKTSFKNKCLRNGDYFAIIAFLQAFHIVDKLR